MRILHINTSDLKGGAAKGAYRLNESLREIGVDSSMLVQHALGSHPFVHSPRSFLQTASLSLRATLDSLPLRFYRQRPATPWSVSWLPNHSLSKQIDALQPAVVHLHWTCGGFMPIQEIARVKAPIVWTLHDMWPLTGGCHYSGDCARYEQECGACPQLASLSDRDLSRWVLMRKSNRWKQAHITLISPSSWMAGCARRSSLFKEHRIEVLSNALDLRIYQPRNKAFARERFNLPREKKLILFADDTRGNPRKGFHLLKAAARKLVQTGWRDKVELVVFGRVRSLDVEDLEMKVTSIGRLQDDASLALLYSAADVFVSPALEENLGYTIMEALACGTPCVAFKIGGTPDLIHHCENGWLATPFETEDFARGLAWVLEDDLRHARLVEAAVTNVKRECDSLLIAQKHLSLYRQLLRQDYQAEVALRVRHDRN